MILGLAPITEAGQLRVELCVMADKPDVSNKPIPVSMLPTSDFAVFFVSNTEGCMIKEDPSDRSLLITPLSPTKIYLTPDVPERPGYSADQVKIYPLGDGEYRIEFERGSGFKPWTPSTGQF